MSEMTEANAALLRKPFPKNVLGVLPKPYKKDSPKSQCKECGGYHGMPAVHLDFVGHAATTDRLLQADPMWSWEPMALDQYGSPQLDRDNNLWIRLTVCGVTRIGVGDGGSMKERIGDAIRNASMRFGVALDLWSKDELEQTSGEGGEKLRATLASNPAPTAAPSTPEQPEQPPAETGEVMDEKTRKQMFALFNERGVTEAEQLPGIKAITGVAYTSRGDLTEAHAQLVIKTLRKKAGASE